MEQRDHSVYALLWLFLLAEQVQQVAKKVTDEMSGQAEQGQGNQKDKEAAQKIWGGWRILQSRARAVESTTGALLSMNAQHPFSHRNNSFPAISNSSYCKPPQL